MLFCSCADAHIGVTKQLDHLLQRHTDCGDHGQHSNGSHGRTDLRAALQSAAHGRRIHAKPVVRMRVVHCSGTRVDLKCSLSAAQPVALCRGAI